MARDTCIVCQIIENKVPSKKVYEDEMVMAVLDVNGANPGHCFVIPKNHYPIIEQVPDREVSRLFQISNKISSAIFETLGVQGTNIFVANGIPAGQTVAHTMVNVIPRKENDGINLQWQPKQIGEEEMSTVELKLKEFAANIGNFDVVEKKDTNVQQSKPEAMPVDDDEEDYFSKQMDRLP